MNEIYEPFVFNSHSQREDKSFKCFCTTIALLVETCNYYTDCVDSIVRDRIVIAAKDSETQRALLKEWKSSLANAVDICKAVENAPMTCGQ